jgi:hypothetical protein
VVLLTFIVMQFKIHNTRTLFISDWGYQLSYLDFIYRYILTSSANRRQFEYLTALHRSFMKTMKIIVRGTDPCGTPDNKSCGVVSVPRQQTWDNLLVR